MLRCFNESVVDSSSYGRLAGQSPKSGTDSKRTPGLKGLAKDMRMSFVYCVLTKQYLMAEETAVLVRCWAALL